MEGTADPRESLQYFGNIRMITAVEGPGETPQGTIPTGLGVLGLSLPPPNTARVLGSWSPARWDTSLGLEPASHTGCLSVSTLEGATWETLERRQARGTRQDSTCGPSPYHTGGQCPGGQCPCFSQTPGPSRSSVAGQGAAVGSELHLQPVQEGGGARGSLPAHCSARPLGSSRQAGSSLHRPLPNYNFRKILIFLRLSQRATECSACLCSWGSARHSAQQTPEEGGARDPGAAATTEFPAISPNE